MKSSRDNLDQAADTEQAQQLLLPGLGAFRKSGHLHEAMGEEQNTGHDAEGAEQVRGIGRSLNVGHDGLPIDVWGEHGPPRSR